MAFNQRKLDKVFNQSRGIYDKYVYRNDSDTIGEITTAGYFQDARFGPLWENDNVVVMDVYCSSGLHTVQFDVDPTSGGLINPVYMPSAEDVNNLLDNTWYVTPASRTGSAVNDALTEARTKGKALLLPFGDYELNSTLNLLSNDKLIIAPTASLTATSSLSGSTMIEVGSDTTYADYFEIAGGGRINAAGEANRCIDIKKGRFSKIHDIDIDGANISAIRLGSNSADDSSYEVDVYNIHIMHEQEENASNSIGIYYERCNDSYLHKSVVVGYRRGVETSSSSFSNEFNQVHVWGREVHGALTRCFSLFGTVTMSQCNADTPFDVIGLGGDLYGFRMSGDMQGALLRCYMNNDIGTDVELDGRVVPFEFIGADCHLTTVRVHGGSATRRFKEFSGGNTGTNFIYQENTGPAANYVTPP